MIVEQGLIGDGRTLVETGYVVCQRLAGALGCKGQFADAIGAAERDQMLLVFGYTRDVTLTGVIEKLDKAHRYCSC
jgi:hypothetical protein